MSAEAKLLVVDDEFNILELLATSLRFAGFEVVTAGNGREAIEKAENEQPDLIVLDVMMPGMDGFEVTRRLRDAGRTYPVLFLTAKDATEDKVAGLGAGGDDYVTKPFSLDEVIARIRAILRRSRNAQEEDDAILRVDDLSLNIDTHEVFLGDEEIDLSPTEFNLLHYLMLNATACFRRHRFSTMYGSTTLTAIPPLWNRTFRTCAARLITTAKDTNRSFTPNAVWAT